MEKIKIELVIESTSNIYEDLINFLEDRKKFGYLDKYETTISK